MPFGHTFLTRLSNWFCHTLCLVPSQLRWETTLTLVTSLS